MDPACLNRSSLSDRPAEGDEKHLMKILFLCQWKQRVGLLFLSPLTYNPNKRISVITQPLGSAALCSALSENRLLTRPEIGEDCERKRDRDAGREGDWGTKRERVLFGTVTPVIVRLCTWFLFFRRRLILFGKDHSLCADWWMRSYLWNTMPESAGRIARIPAALGSRGGVHQTATNIEKNASDS